MIKDLALKLAKLSQGGPKAYGFGPGVHISTTPLKLGGVLHPKQDNKEAVSGSSFPQNLRSKESSKASIKVKIKESDMMSYQVHKFDTVLIREGLGNLSTCFYYTADALKGAVQNRIFEGAQCFADHPTETEEVVRPERSTRDLLGYFENVHYEENGGSGAIVGTLCVSENISSEWALALLTNSLDYAKKFKESDLVGLSINASGDANAIDIQEFISSNQVPAESLPKLMDAKSKGINIVRVVSNLTEAVSCDLVTKAGAGGKILSLNTEGKL